MRPSSIWERVLRVVIQHPRAIALIVLALTAAAVVPAARLRPSADLLSLLPEGSPAAKAYRDFVIRFGGLERIFVLIRPGTVREPAADPAAGLLEVAWAIEEELTGRPGIASARTGIDSADEDFFFRIVAPRAVLLLPEESWRAAIEARIDPERLEQRAEWLRRQILLPGRQSLLPLFEADPLGLLEELPNLDLGSGLPLDAMTSTFQSLVDGATLVVVEPTSSEIDPESGQRLENELTAAFERARERLRSDPHSVFFDPGTLESSLEEASDERAGLDVDAVRIQAIGGPLYAVSDERRIRRDLQATLLTSAIGCGLVMLLAFGSFTLPVLTLLAVTAGLVWLGAALALGIGDVSALSLGFAAVLVALGVDYGIHLATRYREASLGAGETGADPAAAWLSTLRGAGPAIVISALTTAAAFATLAAAHLRPLRELGLVVGLGILLILLASFLVGGPLLMWLGTRSATRPEGRLWRLLGGCVERSVNLARMRPRSVLTAAALLTVVAIPSAARLHLDTDLRALRPEPSPLDALQQALFESFGVGSETATVQVSGGDLGDALTRARRVTSLLHERLPSAEITSPAELVALGDGVERRLEQLADLPLIEAVDRFESALRRHNLDPAAFGFGLEALRSLGAGVDPGLPPPTGWPTWITDSIHAEPSEEGNQATWVALHLRLPEGDWRQGPPRELLASIDAMAPGSSIASSGAVAAELGQLARKDLGRLAFLALGVIAVLVWLGLRRRVGAALLALTPVSLGVLWTLGAISWIDTRLDLISLSLIPILLGIGIDDGLHAVTGAFDDPPEEAYDETRQATPRPVRTLTRSIRDSGRAMTLTTLTTAVGFGSLVLSSLPGLRHGGLALSVGVVACLLATLLVLPALETVLWRRNPT